MMQLRSRLQYAPWLFAVLSICFAASGCNAILGYSDVRVVEETEPSAMETMTEDAGSSSSGSMESSSGSSTGSSTSSGMMPSSSSGALPPKGCGGAVCGANASCVQNKCSCDQGFAASGSNCLPAAVGDPRTHSEAEVCQHWKDGQTLRPPNAWTPGQAECDPGTLAPAAFQDAFNRLNTYRWLVGLTPAPENKAAHSTYMKCAAVASWNVQSAHSPQPGAKCYTSEGAQGAASSNIAWGFGGGSPADAMEQWMSERNGDLAGLGHRRWMLNPPLGPVGLGYYAGGGQYGSATCMQTFNNSVNVANPPRWIAWPPPGFVPLAAFQDHPWSFHTGGGRAKMSVTNGSGAALQMVDMNLGQGGGIYQGTQGFQPQGWQPTAGQIYRVEITGVDASPITYEVKPVNCP
jgi:uncharacterized protein YkwD